MGHKMMISRLGSQDVCLHVAGSRALLTYLRARASRAPQLRTPSPTHAPRLLSQGSDSGSTFASFRGGASAVPSSAVSIGDSASAPFAVAAASSSPSASSSSSFGRFVDAAAASSAPSSPSAAPLFVAAGFGGLFFFV